MKPASLAMGTVFLMTVFVLAPAAMMHVNEALGLPRWQIPGGSAVGVGAMLAGIVVALQCSGQFARIGRGTPVPIEPPKRLVIAGLYRYSRNPMYVAQVAVLFGLFLYRGELLLALHAAIWAGAVASWVVWREEPELRRRFGEEYVRYTRQVPRWIPRRLRRVAG